MPIVLHQRLDLSTMSEGQPRDQPAYYGHPKRQATKCRHLIHPSASQHTPLCPDCITSRINTAMDLALQGLVTEGGLARVEHMRDRRWQRAKLRYEVMKQRQAKIRSRNQLREEREQAWEEAHQRSDLGRSWALMTFTEPAKCPVCATTLARYPIDYSVPQEAREVTWWERPGGLVAHHILVRRTPSRPVQQARQSLCMIKSSPVLRTMIREFRKAMAISDRHKEMWETRYRTQCVVRRKHTRGEGYTFKPNFWDDPISASLSLYFYQQSKDNQRIVERQARGDTLRPKPPRSSLSYSERSDDIETDESVLEQMWKTEELEIQERQARKIGEEIGYLYLVGKVDGLDEWRRDFLRSDHQLVYRKTASEPNFRKA
jgi:hypothetical protein